MKQSNREAGEKIAREIYFSELILKRREGKPRRNIHKSKRFKRLLITYWRFFFFVPNSKRREGKLGEIGNFQIENIA